MRNCRYRRFSVGDWSVDPASGRIAQGDREVALRPKEMALLAYLAEREGEVISRDEIVAHVWDGLAVSDDALYFAVSHLRKALGDDSHRPVYIETLPKRGYRLIASVRPSEEDRAQALDGKASPLSRAEEKRIRKSRLHPAAIWAAAVTAAGLLAVPFLGGREVVRNDAGLPTIAEQASVAVLPFADLSAAGGQAYFAQGLAEELMNRLGRLEGLRVAGRASSFSFRESTTDLRTIGETLGVANILEGSVRREGDRVRVTARLVRATDGEQLWSRRFDRELGQIFAVQDEIAVSVAGALSIALGVDARNRLRGAGTTSFEAYDSFLAASALLRDHVNIDQAIVLLERAIALDPDYAAAWANLAWAYGHATWFVVGDGKRELFEKGYRAALRAVELGPNLADSRVILAQMARAARNDWLGAEPEYAKALELSTDAVTLFLYSTMLSRAGRIERALTYANLSAQYDPLYPSPPAWRVLLYTALGRHSDALAELARLEALGDPSLADRRLYILLNLEDPAQVKRQLAGLADSSSPAGPHWRSVLSEFNSPPSALRELRRFYADRSSHGPNSRLKIALLAAYFGDPDWALELMSEDLRDGTTRAHFLWMPVMKEMRRLPGFKRLVTELGLVPYWRKYGWPEACWPVGAEDFVCG